LARTPGTGDSVDGTGASARFNGPEGVALDGQGNLYVADTLNHAIRKIVLASGEVSSLAGVAGVYIGVRTVPPCHN
jgi:sugar lactone lactonase YvrE